jgi:predicted GNAT family N-acyltransferase
MDGVVLRPMTAADLPHAHALSAELRWPHRPADWAQMFSHAEGIVAERDGEIVATGLRWLWGERHATIGLVIVTPACQGRRIGHRLMRRMLEGLEDRTVLLHATAEGRGLYERLGFVRTGEMRQHQGIALSPPLVALQPGWRLRPAGLNELPALQALDAAARGMPRDALIADLLQSADACVVLDHDNEPAASRCCGASDAAIDRPGGGPRCRGREGADRASCRCECRPFHAHRHRLRERVGRMAREHRPPARGRAHDDGARHAARGAAGRARAVRDRHSGRRLTEAAMGTTTFIYKSDPVRGRQWAEVFRRRAPEIDFRIWPDIGDAARVRFLAAWEPPEDMASDSRICKCCSPRAPASISSTSLHAACRVAGGAHGRARHRARHGRVRDAHAVLDLHRDMPRYRRQQQEGQWRALPVRPAGERRVGVLGLGSLGQAVLAQLVGLGFDCAGWSRSRHALDGVQCHAGADELPAFLARTDILVCLLPLTDSTRGFLDARLFSMLPEGAGLVHVGRGPQLVQADLLPPWPAGRSAMRCST